ncbi:MAG: hypothetical protein L6Q57_02675 [Alphaproteobacteria bacterium]|nr:hypothetical protein [Alphaproteobacteria bacterium]
MTDKNKEGKSDAITKNCSPSAIAKMMRFVLTTDIEETTIIDDPKVDVFDKYKRAQELIDTIERKIQQLDENKVGVFNGIIIVNDIDNITDKDGKYYDPLLPIAWICKSFNEIAYICNKNEELHSFFKDKLLSKFTSDGSTSGSFSNGATIESFRMYSYYLALLRAQLGQNITSDFVSIDVAVEILNEAIKVGALDSDGIKRSLEDSYESDAEVDFVNGGWPGLTKEEDDAYRDAIARIGIDSSDEEPESDSKPEPGLG